MFRSEVRDFCGRELPAETKRKNLEGQHIGRDGLGVWMQRLRESRFIGQARTQLYAYFAAAAYNLLRISRLTMA